MPVFGSVYHFVNECLIVLRVHVCGDDRSNANKEIAPPLTKYLGIEIDALFAAWTISLNNTIKVLIRMLQQVWRHSIETADNDHIEHIA